MLICSDDVQASVLSTHVQVLSVRPLIVIPPSSAPASVVEALARTMFLSPTARVVLEIVVVVPLTVRSPLRTKLVPVATPMSGVTSVGEVSMTKVVPVPVCAATEVAFPEEVIGPVKFAFVVTVAAEPVVFWFKVGNVQLVKSPLEGVPSAGVTSVGEVSMTKVVPVPVCAATEVALPTDVIGPVMLAFVVTVGAKSGPPIAITLVATPKLSSPKP